MELKIKNILNDFSNRVKNLLGNNLIGIYLTGSIALGGYHDGKSDIDFTVITVEPVSKEQASSLKLIHKVIKKKYPKNILEGHYITPEVLGKSRSEVQPVISYYKGIITKDYHGISIVTWFGLKKYGVTVCGLPAKNLRFEAPIEELLKYVIDNVNTYWRNWLSHSSNVFSIKSIYALTGASVEWCVLGLARMYFTLSENDLTSKDKVIGYALSHLPNKYESIIKEAQYIRTGFGRRHYYSPFKRRKDMIQYMDYMISQCNLLYLSKKQA